VCVCIKRETYIKEKTERESVNLRERERERWKERVHLYEYFFSGIRVCVNP